jgi:uncharacterized 2Fe-2S/4Fe-4S cluster protein (DUF4445 family)
LGVFVDAPCGGVGKCGKCTVIADGKAVLACRTAARAGMRVELPDASADSLIAKSSSAQHGKCHTAVIDLGTTTITAALIDESGAILARTTEMNAQRVFGADVLSRLQAAVSGELAALRDSVRAQIGRMCREILGEQRVKKSVVVGNTAMLHLLFGADCSGLGRYPYQPAFLEAREERGSFFGWDWTKMVNTPPCLHAFCGADITAGLLTLADAPRPYLLADLGTNAELALCTDAGLFVTSAAAGPVFEGAGISCGMPALPGAVCGFSILGARTKIVAIAGSKPCGICAGGLVDVLAELRRTYQLRADGSLAQAYQVAAGITITQADVRAFQLAKAAVAAGVELLCAHADIDPRELKMTALSGSLGSALSLANTMRLGIFGRAIPQIALGNSALAGGILYALLPKAVQNADKIAQAGEYIDLSLVTNFQDSLLKNMTFSS